jgi:hypothetical protein
MNSQNVDRSEQIYLSFDRSKSHQFVKPYLTM